MKPGIPWSVKGIDEDARVAAKGAARRSGMTLGEWLNAVILESADEPGAARPARLEDIAQQVARMMKEEPEPESALLRRILDRISTGERRAVDALGLISDQLGSLGEQISRQRRDESADESERRMRGLFDTLRAETASRHEADALRVAIEQVSARVAQGQDMRPLADIEARLGAAFERIDRAEQGLGRLSRVEADIEALSEQLATMPAAAQEGIEHLREAFAQLSGRLADCEIAVARGKPGLHEDDADDFIAAARRAVAAKSSGVKMRSSGPSRGAIFASVILLAAITAFAMGWVMQPAAKAHYSGSSGVWGELMDLSQHRTGARQLAMNLAQ